MSKIVQYVSVAPHDLLQTSNNSNVAATPGSAFKTDDGRTFKYVLAGAVDLATGVAVQSPINVSAHQNIAASTQAIGDKVVTVTLGATAATQGEYNGGFLEVISGTGAGQRLKIATNAAAALSTTMLITLEDGFVLATSSTDTKVNLILNPYVSVILNPTTETGAVLGVTVCPIPATTYGYVQTGGLATVKFDAVGSTTIGNSVESSGTVAGSFTLATSTNAVVGFSAETIAASTYGSVYLQLP